MELPEYTLLFISTKQYREDARNRILPIIAVNGITQNQPELLFSELNNAFSTQEDLLDQADGWLFFSINKKNIAVLRKPKKDDLVMILESTVIWKRGTTDDRIYVRDSENVCLPLEIENVGNGIAKRLSVGLCRKSESPHYETEILLKQNEKRKIYIFSKEKIDEIKGQYLISVIYSDIAGNRYKQVFPLELTVNEKNRRIKSLDLSGTPQLIWRDSSHADA